MNSQLKEEFAELSKALAHPHRIEIIQILADKSKNKRCMVNNLVDKLPISQSTVSQHLKILKNSGWIRGIINGPRVCYCLRENVFEKYMDYIKKLKNED